MARQRPAKTKGNNARSTQSGALKTNFERFTALARAAAAAGDEIDAQNYYQHAEHYYRMMQRKAA